MCCHHGGVRRAPHSSEAALKQGMRAKKCWLNPTDSRNVAMFFVNSFIARYFTFPFCWPSLVFKTSPLSQGGEIICWSWEIWAKLARSPLWPNSHSTSFSTLVTVEDAVLLPGCWTYVHDFFFQAVKWDLRTSGTILASVKMTLDKRVKRDNLWKFNWGIFGFRQIMKMLQRPCCCHRAGLNAWSWPWTGWAQFKRVWCFDNKLC